MKKSIVVITLFLSLSVIAGECEIRTGDSSIPSYSWEYYSKKLVGTYQGDCTVEEAAAAGLLLIIKP